MSVATVVAYGNPPRSEMLKYLPAGATCVLDVGCHKGGFGRALKQAGVATVWGVEPNPETATEARQHLDTVVTGFFAADTVPDHQFDAIFFNDVLEHMPEPEAALRVAAAKLKPGGVVVASIPNIRHIDNLMHILRDKDFRYEDSGIRDRTHLRFFTKKSIPRLFADGGYDIRKLDGINESWWSPSPLRRLAFRLWGTGYLEDTRFVQYAVVAQPQPAPH
jgi:2-polyprenyl-3-methyl-5-hydroxy-6-metoxy-1,4-benzoquinol methylase